MKKQKRNRERIQLPNGCECSQLSVTPANWESMDADTGRPWVISYNFYSPAGMKPVQRRGMNDYKDLKKRQGCTRDLIADELDQLKNKGYNPILDQYIAPPSGDDDNDYLIPPNTPFATALQQAFDNFEGECKTDLKSSLNFIQKSTRLLRYHDWPVKDIRRRHLVRILKNMSKVKDNFNNSQYNNYRKALLMLYRIFVRYETVEANLVTDIEIKNHAPEPRKALTVEQRRMIDQRLKINNFRFWNFIHCFFHSGGRLTEMARLKGKHVDFDRQEVTFLVKKGKDWSWVVRPMPDEAVPFWRRAMAGCGPEQYLFSKGLIPGDTQINSKQYTRRWRTWIIKPVKGEGKKHNPKGKKERIEFMNVHLYDLKHTRTTELGDALNAETADLDNELARANGHTTAKMVKGIYDLKNKRRKDDKIKSAPVRFA